MYCKNDSAKSYATKASLVELKALFGLIDHSNSVFITQFL